MSGEGSSSATASRVAVRAGLDVEMNRLLSAIRAESSAVVHEAEVLVPLLLALSIAPIPTEDTQTLAAEVLAKVMVAAHHSEQQQPTPGSRRRVIDVLLVTHRALDALEIALGTAVSTAVTTSVLELFFVVASISSQATGAILSNPGLLKALLSLLPAGVPAHVCYVATLLQSMAQVSNDAAAILCSYHVHTTILEFLDDHLEDDVSVTAVGMLLRVLLVLFHGSPHAFRHTFASSSSTASQQGGTQRQPRRIMRLIRRCVASSWSDIADLGCLLLSGHLQRHHAARLERQGGLKKHRNGGGGGGNNLNEGGNAPTREELAGFVRELLATPASNIKSTGSEGEDLVLVLSSLICMPHAHLAVSAAYALLWLAFLAPCTISDLVCGNAVVLHNMVATLLEERFDAAAPALRGEGDMANRPCERRASPARRDCDDVHADRMLTALVLASLLLAGSPRSKTIFAAHVHRYLSSTTRATLAQRLAELLTAVDDTLLQVLLYDVKGVGDVLSRTARIPIDTSDGGARGRTSSREVGNRGDDHSVDELRMELSKVCHTVLLVAPKATLHLDQSRHLHGDVMAEMAADKYKQRLEHEPGGGHHSLEDLVQDLPRTSTHSATFIHNSIRTVIRLASNYAHNNDTNNNNNKTTTTAGQQAVRDAPGQVHSRPPSPTNNLWAPPTRHQVDRRWSVEHLERGDVFLFDCPVDHLTPGLADVLQALALHVARLKHELNVCAMSKPLRRCVLLDLYSHVYPTLVTCLQFISQRLASEEDGVAALAIRVIADGGGSSRSVSSANVVDLYHAIGLSA